MTLKLRKLKRNKKKNRKKENKILSIGKCKNHKMQCCIVSFWIKLFSEKANRMYEGGSESSVMCVITLSIDMIDCCIIP